MNIYKEKEIIMSAFNTTSYARKAFFVDAVQVADDNMEDVANWCNGKIVNPTKEGSRPFVKVKVKRPLNARQTHAFVGDWVLYAGTGFKVYTDEAFHKNFEPLA